MAGHRRYSITAAVVCVALVGTLALAAVLAPHPARAAGGPRQAKTGIYVLNVGELNTQSGSYKVDFYLTFQCPETCDASGFELMNGTILSKDQQENTPTEEIFRVRASLSTNIDMRGYPFDRHDLPILLEDREQPDTQLVYVPDRALSGVDANVTVGGWNLDGWHADVTQHYYPPFKSTYSRYEFDVVVGRGIISSILKALVPALIIVGSGFLALLLGPGKALQRLGIGTSALVGAILFHINLTSQVPPVGYLTVADKFMIANYTGLLGTLIATVVLLVIEERVSEARAWRFHRVSGIAVLAVWLAAQGLVVLSSR